MKVRCPECKKQMKMLCKLGIHSWIYENSYTGSSESGYKTTGLARMCLECGLIEITGTAHVPVHWKRWQKEMGA